MAVAVTDALAGGWRRLQGGATALIEGLMHIHRIQLRNYRCFAKLDLDLPAAGAVFFGWNGSGKSTLVDGIVAALSALPELRVQDAGRRSRLELGPRDIRALTRRHGQSWKRVLTDRAELTVHLDMGAGPRVLASVKRTRSDVSGGEDLPAPPKAWTRRMNRSKGNKGVLPLVAAYTGNRPWLDRQAPSAADGSLRDGGDRVDGYRDALDAGRSLADLRRRWRDLDHHRKDLQLRGDPLASQHPLFAIEVAVATLLERPDVLPMYDTEARDVMIDVPDQGHLTLSEVSDGYRNIVAMAADLATRAVTLNPWLGARAPVETPGVVLIDEVDLHLHPAWQRRVLPDLQAAFPAVQFLVTTHSPQVLGSAERRLVYLVDGGQVGRLSVATRGRDSNALLVEAMGATERDPEYERKLQSLAQAIDQEDVVRAGAMLRELEAIWGVDEPSLALHRWALEALGG